MRASHESSSTTGGAPDPRAAGVWTLAGDALIIVSADGPATVLVPSEQVSLLAVDLPLNSRAKRIEALPFAIEERIADSPEAVHLALGIELSPKRYLAGVVRHEVMESWVSRADEAGLGHAAMVPDALALPVPAEGCWSVDLGDTRALVRVGDGTGFACAAPLLRTAWEAAGKPPCIAYGAPLPADMLLTGADLEPLPLANRLLAPALDLRQGRYPRSNGRMPNIWRRLAWIVVIGAAAHALIAGADTVMLRRIANQREAETQALVASMGGPAGANPIDLVPQPGPAAAPQIFLPLLSRISAALTPMRASFATQAIAFESGTLTMDLLGSEPGLAARLQAALTGAGIKASVSDTGGGNIRITASRA